DWQNEFNTHFPEDKHPKWPELNSFKGKLAQSPQVLLEALQYLLSILRTLNKLYVYTHLRHDENITNETHKAAHQQITNIINEFQADSSWFEPELLTLSEETLAAYINSPVLADYSFYIEKIVKVRKHTLTPDNEHLLALSSKSLQGYEKIFAAIDD